MDRTLGTIMVAAVARRPRRARGSPPHGYDIVVLIDGDTVFEPGTVAAAGIALRWQKIPQVGDFSATPVARPAS